MTSLCVMQNGTNTSPYYILILYCKLYLYAYNAHMPKQKQEHIEYQMNLNSSK